MSQGPLLDTNSPLSADQASHLNEALGRMDRDQMTWLSGYLAGLTASGAASGAGAGASSAAATAALPEITVLYGSQTGNAEGVAELARDRALARGFNVRFVDMADMGKKDLKDPANLMIVVSTQGDGEPPDTAIGFHELISGRKAPRLDGHRYAVLGLGDSSYEQFCQMGKEYDARFADLGAERIAERVDCDVDFEEPAEAWIEDILSRFATLAGATEGATQQAPATGAGENPWSKKNPFYAEVLDSVVLNDEGSDKETRHIELSIEGSGLSYEPGDALGVVPQNDPAHVDELLERLGIGPESPLENGTPIRDALVSEFEVTTLTRPFLEKWAELGDNPELRRLLSEEAREEFRTWSYGRHIIDAIETFPVEGLDAQAFTQTLRKLPPRLYSIASSYNADPDEVHLTVGVVRYSSHGRARNGVTTGYLADRVQPGDRVPVYIDRNKNFKLPHDPHAPIIMVGPGTGVAPFRAFMQEREDAGADGDNWLFFGDRHFRTDFLYQAEWLNWREKGLLTRLDVAFSRDQTEKVYVQDRLREQGAALWQWLERGAHFYICGDGERMAADVHKALLDVVQQYGGHDEESAAGYLRDLQQAKRYQRDVY